MSETYLFYSHSIPLPVPYVACCGCQLSLVADAHLSITFHEVLTQFVILSYSLSSLSLTGPKILLKTTHLKTSMRFSTVCMSLSFSSLSAGSN